MTTVNVPARQVIPRRGFNLAFLGHDIRRQITFQNLLFTVALPAVLYLALFNIASNDATMPHGNFRMWMMIGIAVYGSCMGAITRAAGIGQEKHDGWLRVIRLSPLGPGGYVATRVCSCQAFAILPVLVIGLLGCITGAKGDMQAWIVGLGVAWLGAAVFSALGLFMGLGLPLQIVLNVPGILLTALAFLGNIFIPLSGIMLTISQFTPLYGITTLARYALTNGQTFSGVHESILGAVVNIVVWFAIFAVAAIGRFTRATVRQ